SLADFIYGLDSGFWTARCLHVVAELGVADHIGDDAQTIINLANATGAEPNALGRVMRLLAMHDVFAGSAGQYRHTPASLLLRSDHPQSVRPWVRLHGSDIFWQCSGDLLTSVRTGATAM